MSESYLRIYYGNKSTGRYNFNFDIKELIDNFSFSKFISDARKNPSEDYGGFLICTPKQYVIGYNPNFGTGSHGSAFGKAMREIKGGGEITTERELLSLGSECEKTYFCGRLLYECVGSDQYGRPIFDGRLVFLTAKSISLKMFESFKKFCEDYGKEINLAIKNSNGTFYLSYYSKELKKSFHTTDLNEIINYVESHIDYDYEVDTDENIIGVSTTNQMII